MALIAGDIMDQVSGTMLNDLAKNLYTYSVQIPFLRKATEDLEQLLLKYGISVQLKKSVVIPVVAGAVTLALPADFLLPISLYERATGSTSESDWTLMYEREWESNSDMANILVQWSFRGDVINLVGATTNRDVKLYYQRMLTILVSENTTEDSYLFKAFLAAKTAEYCARYVGMNKIMADEIRDNESSRAEDNLTHIFVGNMQGVRHRRLQYTTRNRYVIR